jgi:type I restriction enzyme M protein
LIGGVARHQSGREQQGGHFEEFLRLLPTRAESDLSWTVDMDERKRVAAGDAQPLKAQAAAKSQQAAQVLQRVAELKRAPSRDESAIEEGEANAKELTRESRTLLATAKEIEDAVF